MPDYEINVLNFETVENYIGKLPIFKEQLPIANISDYIRLALLNQYGGIYMDASIFITENFDWFLNKINGYDAFVFYTDMYTNNLSYPIIENWFIASPKNSPFIQSWFNEYKNCVLSDSPNHYYDGYYDNQEFLQKFNQDDEHLVSLPYLKCYLSAMKILREQKFNLLIARSGSVGHYYNYKFFYNFGYMTLALLRKNKNSVSIPKLIKFTNESRINMCHYIKKRKYSSHSLFGQALNEYFGDKK